MEIYTFDKSLQERLVELTEILSSRGEVVPASQIKVEWSYHIELVIEPVGWQALWKIPRLTCQDFEIHYPTIVVVQVEHIYFSELSALVKITAVQDEIHLPEKYDVPLVELYPTKQQEHIALDMIGTANCIDQLRFFFNYLWMPWDIDDDDNADWVALHLEARIRLFFDMKRGIVNSETCDVIRSLMREGREIQEKISRLEESISDEEEDHEGLVDEGKACQLMKYHFRLQQIKTEMEVLENPAMRDMLSRNKTATITEKETRKLQCQSRQPEGHFVWLGGSVEEMKEALNNIQNLFPQNMILKTSGSLQEALNVCEANDIILLSEGHHEIRSAGGLEEANGIIRGISKMMHTIIKPKEAEGGPSLLDFSNEVTLENISINLGDLQAGIIIRKSLVTIRNCNIYASNQSTVKLGLVILPGANVVVENTSFVGLGTAVLVYGNGIAKLEECSFKDCVEGVQVHDDAKLQATKCILENFKEYAIRIETQKYLSKSESKSGSVDLLENVKEIVVNDCLFRGNGKGDITIKPTATFGLGTKQDELVNIS